MKRQISIVLLGLLCAAGCGPRKKDVGPDAAVAMKPKPRPRADPWLALERRIPSTKARPLTAELATRLVRLSLHCVGREYPNKPGDVQTGDRDLLPPRKLHPAFYGCFDWHSAVHGHWAMVRILKRFPKLQPVPAIRRALGRHLTPTAIGAEVEYFAAKHRRLFERPYGWAWLLRLAAELRGWADPDGRRWADALRPLARQLETRVIDYLLRLSVPVRAGTHASTAFALAHIHDYARIAERSELRRAVEKAARRFYLGDRDCPTAYEPSGEDFLSPCLAEADLMRRVLGRSEFRQWFKRFLPPFASERFVPLVKPPKVLDRKDPRIGHLIGLSLHRAWTMRGIAGALPEGPRRRILAKLADLHREDALRLMFDSGYGGAHWLASFAIYLMTDVGLGVRPAR